jgi:hypothetical protein
MKTADQTARVGKDARAKAVKEGRLTVPLVVKAKEEGGEDASMDFLLAENVGIMPLMEWAAASDRDVQSADGLKAVYYVLQDVVDEGDWPEFRKFSREAKAEAGELLDFANAALEALAGRPTKDASGSSDGS